MFFFFVNDSRNQVSQRLSPVRCDPAVNDYPEVIKVTGASSLTATRMLRICRHRSVVNPVSTPPRPRTLPKSPVKLSPRHTLCDDGRRSIISTRRLPNADSPPVLPSWPQCRYLVFIKAHCVDVRLRRYEAAGSKIRLNHNFISLLQT